MGWFIVWASVPFRGAPRSWFVWFVWAGWDVKGLGNLAPQSPWPTPGTVINVDPVGWGGSRGVWRSCWKGDRTMEGLTTHGGLGGWLRSS